MRKLGVMAAALVWGLWAGMTARGGIDQVLIEPPAPEPTDPILIKLDGWAPSAPAYVAGAVFNRNDPELELNLEMYFGPLTVLTEWDYTHNIGTLSAGDYHLTVRAYEASFGLWDRKELSFKVLPEPAGLSLLAVCGLLARRWR